MTIILKTSLSFLKTHPPQPNPTKMTDFVDYTQFDPAKISNRSPEEKPIPDQTGSYKQFALQYNYGTTDKPVVGDLYLQLPIIKSTGIIKKETPNKVTGKVKTEYSLMFRLSLQDYKLDPADAEPIIRASEHADFIERFNNGWKAISYILASVAAQVGIDDYDPEKPGIAFKNPLYWPRDKVTRKLIAGREPSLWVKIITAKQSRTLFTNMEGEAIKWELLDGVDLISLPLVKIEKVYIGGGKCSLQLKLASTIVVDSVASGSQTRQLSSIESLNSRFPSLAAHSAAKLSELEMAKQDSLVNTNQNFNSFTQQPAANDGQSFNSYMGAQQGSPPHQQQQTLPQSLPQALPQAIPQQSQSQSQQAVQMPSGVSLGLGTGKPIQLRIPTAGNI